MTNTDDPDDSAPPVRVKRWLRRSALLILLLALGVGLWSFWWEPRHLVLREVAMDLPCWTDEPLLLGVVSDLHVGSPGIDLAKLDRVVQRINEKQPEVVLLLGDFVIQGLTRGRSVPPETIAQHLRTLQAPLGVYAVLGNHDWWLDAPRVTNALTSAGIRVIDDTAVPIHSAERELWIAGISDFWEGRHDVATVAAALSGDAPVIAITHNPDVFPMIPARVCLTVAGHTHGGQVALPLIGRPVVPARYGQRYAAGHIQEQGRHLYVTTGVGTSILPVRFRVPPEVLLLRLQ